METDHRVSKSVKVSRRVSPAQRRDSAATCRVTLDFPPTLSSCWFRLSWCRRRRSWVYNQTPNLCSSRSFLLTTLQFEMFCMFIQCVWVSVRHSMPTTRLQLGYYQDCDFAIFHELLARPHT
ncbi:hypothetical protein GYMLUDRAFT_869227 [Collybiopsis luxurians FD-317 M1]|nr:hypothetical protein GYMLUDRAFT_869227 [Collybiopsis luxurians FD-317 M1]